MKDTTRWRIKALLAVETPLFIGSGDVITNRIPDKNDVEVSAFAVDCDNSAYIPGSTIKGNLRSWMRGRLTSEGVKVFNQVFGYGGGNNTQGEGGGAEFLNAHVCTVNPGQENVPYWNAVRRTGVEASTVINRQTGAVREKKLMHQEFVPPGVTFKAIITGDMTEEEVGLILAALNGFGGQSPLVVGAETGSGKGRLSCREIKVFRLTPEGLVKWIEDGTAIPLDDIFDPVNRNEEERIMDDCCKRLLQDDPKPIFRLSMTLEFDSPFMVNDPSRGQEQGADHLPLVDADGNVVLPAKSFRGTFRSQAERIIRTLGGDACLVDDPESSCPSVDTLACVYTDLCMSCQVFGGPGWKSPVSLSDFTLIEGTGRELPHRQEFVAIDRFTGGGAAHLKFNAHPYLAPHLKGTLEVDLSRIKPWGLGLLALTLRDLVEGDITFGFGAAKGYGTCTVHVTEAFMSSNIPWPDWLGARSLTGDGLAGHIITAMDDAHRPIINALVNDFRSKIQQIREVPHEPIP